MRIYGSIQLHGEAVEGSSLSSANRAPRTNDKPLEAQDQVELSESARDHRKVREILQSVPDVRQDRIESLKRSIAEGTYNIPGRDVARKMLEEMKNDPAF
jgi:negative regulator of flagellin synthesis FlgM